MPYGATALDFAYDIHSKIGNSAIGAKINHKIEPITTQINSGDQIESSPPTTHAPKPNGSTSSPRPKLSRRSRVFSNASGKTTSNGA